MKQLAEKVFKNKNFDVELMNLVAKLHTQLADSKGKKVYGYLKFDVKKTVDEIFMRLASNESVKKMYNLWCEMEQQKHDVYSSAKIQFFKDRGFFIPHRSYLVNYRFIRGFQAKIIIMTNDTQIPISDNRRKEIFKIQLMLENGD